LAGPRAARQRGKSASVASWRQRVGGGSPWRWRSVGEKARWSAN